MKADVHLLQNHMLVKSNWGEVTEGRLKRWGWVGDQLNREQYRTNREIYNNGR